MTDLFSIGINNFLFSQDIFNIKWMEFQVELKLILNNFSKHEFDLVSQLLSHSKST